MFSPDRKVSEYEPGQVLDFGDYLVRLRVSERARRISVRIDNRTGDAIVTAPRPKYLKDAVEFAKTRHDWILETRRGQSRPVPFAPGMQLTIKGYPVMLAERTGVISPKAEQQADGSWQLVSSGDVATYARRVERYLRTQAQKTFQLETDRLASKLGVSGVKVSLFDAHGRWGSCSPSKKSIRYSWRVIMAPTDVLVYLAAHEVAHLRHPDHSPAFWATVNELLGKPYKPGRAWLKARGHELFKYAAAKDLKG
ncbi:M48 family metallopeptidase [Asticcacaulis solisilvae]|uniref:M48 family metallopeptidase n=1 Tax=Asticcacaulis solisilvae TaxID=1217274 RepID=UPI003FD87559